MKKLVLVCIFIFATFLVQAQSKSDVCEGNFSVPSYKTPYDKDGYDAYTFQVYKFSDGTEGTLFHKTKCGKYFVKQMGVEFHYNDLSTAIKALYAYKKYGCVMDGVKDCN
jgi:hypothetical protein